ncbi:MAG TPA: DUF72 domain-containing protein [Firmicutes bacterium]|nr:DUF72 domain-containing protein [Bacillota bacterium]
MDEGFTKEGKQAQVGIDQVKIGTSGYNYPHWGKGVFYPEGLSSSKWLQYYAEHFDSLELNVTFYRIPEEKTFDGWYRRTPEGFAFSLKGPRLITHLKKLQDVGETVELFFTHAFRLREKLVCVLWQFPPHFEVSLKLLEGFVSILPKEVHHAFEFRDRSWFCREVFEILRAHNMSICLADRPFKVTLTKSGNDAIRGSDSTATQGNDSIIIPSPTADFVYLRRHGLGSRYSSCYTDEELAADAMNIRQWATSGLQVYVYFNNDARGYAVRNAETLRSMVSQFPTV